MIIVFINCTRVSPLKTYMVSIKYYNKIYMTKRIKHSKNNIEIKNEKREKEAKLSMIIGEFSYYVF